MNSIKLRIEEVNNGLLLTVTDAGAFKEDKVLGRYVFLTDEELLKHLAATLATRRNNAKDRS